MYILNSYMKQNDKILNHIRVGPIHWVSIQQYTFKMYKLPYLKLNQFPILVKDDCLYQKNICPLKKDSSLQGLNMLVVQWGIK